MSYMNSALAEYETENGVMFRVIKENWSNHKNPTHPGVLERYDGSQWCEVDRWDIASENSGGCKPDETIISQAEDRINNKSVFDKDGKVVSVTVH